MKWNFSDLLVYPKTVKHMRDGCPQETLVCASVVEESSMFVGGLVKPQHGLCYEMI